MSTDVRALPAIDLEPGQVEQLLAPLLGNATVASVAACGDGLVNRVYRVDLTGSRPSVALRIYASGVHAFEKERRLLARVAMRLPVPELLLAVPDGPALPFPYVVYRWFDGITLNACRRLHGPAALLSLAEPLGRLLGSIASVDVEREVAPSVDASSAVTTAVERLRNGPARARLGSSLADALADLLRATRPRLEELDHTRGLAHGDFSGRNVIVSPGDGAWHVAAVLDWEHAVTAATLWDVGSLFRYTRRYSSEFRDRFARAYRRSGRPLPEDWHRTARLLDATRLVGILGGPVDLPGVFAECGELVEALVREDAT